MPFIHSKLSKFYIDNAAGALTDISTYVDSVTFNSSLDEVETTTFGAQRKQYITGFAEGEISIGGNWDRTFDVLMSALETGFTAGTIATVTFEYGPEGNDSGDKRYTSEAVLTEYEVESSIQDQVTWTATLRVTGNFTHNTY